MKTINTLILIATGLLFINCSSDDDDNNVNNPHAEFVGEYNLTYLGAPQAVDYNQDGTPSENLMEETVCYNDSEIILNEDMTYTMNKSYVFFISETGCNNEETFGTWDVNGNILTLTDLTMELPAHRDYSIVDNTLLRTDEGAQYPSRDESGNPIYAEGDLQYTFTKAN
jgi:hypothetical protein